MTAEACCPLCAGQMDPPKALEVCVNCHQSLQIGGALPVSSTGEFAAVPMGHARRVLVGTPLSAYDDQDTIICSWCSKSNEVVKKLLSHGDIHICNECVALCSEVLALELGDDWNDK